MFMNGVYLVIFLQSSSEAELEPVSDLLLRALHGHPGVPPGEVAGEGGGGRRGRECKVMYVQYN